MALSRDDTGANSWTEYRRLVMSGLDKLGNDIAEVKEELSNNVKSSKNELEKKIDDLSRKFNKFEIQVTIDITTLKTKASIWGGIFGAIASLIISIVIALAKNK